MRCVNYQCDLCGAEYVSYTSQHLFQRIDEHRYSAISNNDHGRETTGDLINNFSVLKKCYGKLECLTYEMLFIKKKRPFFNTQSDSLRARLYLNLSSFTCTLLSQPVAYSRFLACAGKFW